MKKRDRKKLEQIYRRDYRHLAQANAEFIKDIFKPRPKWIPMFLWMWFIKLFIKTK